MEVDGVRCRVPGHQHHILIQRAAVEPVIGVRQNLQGKERTVDQS